MARKKPIKKFVTRNLSESIERSVEDVVDSGIDVSELISAIEKEPTVRAESSYSQETLDELVEQVNKGRSIPGQSLTNNPDNPYPWERPAKYSNPREALTVITTELLQKDTALNIVNSLVEGEMIDFNGEKKFFAYDMLFFKGEDIRRKLLISLRKKK